MKSEIRNEIMKNLHNGHVITVREVVQILIEETVKKYDNNKTHAAIALGISIRTLRNKLKRYGYGEKEKA